MLNQTGPLRVVIRSVACGLVLLILSGCAQGRGEPTSAPLPEEVQKELTSKFETIPKFPGSVELPGTREFVMHHDGPFLRARFRAESYSMLNEDYHQALRTAGWVLQRVAGEAGQEFFTSSGYLFAIHISSENYPHDIVLRLQKLIKEPGHTG